MKLLFSEAPPDYAGKVFPWAVWAFPEPGETPADLFAAGFLPSARDLSRWYLARQVRVDLARFSPSSENRRILRKGSDLVVEIVPAEAFALGEREREVCLAYARERFGEGVMGPERLDGLFACPMTSHVLVASDPGGREVGWVALHLQEPRTGFYSWSFSEPSGRERNLGMFLMTACVDRLARDGFAHLHLGTCYSRSALYKTNFPGTEFWDGTRWRDDLEALRYLLSREAPGHLFEDPQWLERFAPEGPEAWARAGAFSGRREG